MMTAWPLITAHTGCEDTPENSLESIRAGVAAGADTIEVDVRAARDGTPILMHDPTVMVHGRETPVQDLAMDELSGVTTLDEALELICSEHVMANLDVKDDRCIDGVVDLVKHHDASGMVVITGCPPSRAALVRNAAPELPVLLNAELPDRSSGRDVYLDAVRAACLEAISHGCRGINVSFEQCRPELVACTRQRYLPVSVWTVNSSRDMKRVMKMGVHSITTHRPGKLAKLLGRGSLVTHL